MSGSSTPLDTLKGHHCIKGELHNVLTVLRLNPPRHNHVMNSPFPSIASSSSPSAHSFPRTTVYAQYYRIQSTSGCDVSPLVRSLQELYDHIYSASTSASTSGHHSSSFLTARQVLAPFLSVILSEACDLFTTASALHSIHKFLLYGLLYDANYDVTGLSDIIETVTRCSGSASANVGNVKEESRNRLTEEVEIVHMKILDTLMECLRVEHSRALNEEAILKCVTECLCVRKRRGSSVLLKRHAENTLMQMVLLLFARLPHASSATSDAVTASALVSSDSAGVPTLPPMHAAWQHTRGCTESLSSSLSSSPARETNESRVEHLHLASASEREDDVEESSASAISSLADQEGYGIECLQKVFLMIVDLIDPSRFLQAKHNTEMAISLENDRVLGLRLIRTVLETGGVRLGAHPALVWVIQDRLCKHILQISQTQHLFVLSLVLRIVFDLFQSVKSHLRVQLEVFFVSIHLRIGESANSTHDQRELVMESLVEFCREPSLIVGLYRNYDCQLGATDLFQDTCKFLASRSSLSSSNVVTRADCLALEAMVAVVLAIERRFCTNEESVGGHSNSNSFMHVSAASPIASVASCAPYHGTAPGEYVGEDEEGLSSAEEEAMLHKARADKKRLTAAVTLFNAEGPKSFLKLQTLQVLSDPLTADSVVAFFRRAPGLDKAKVGSFLGGHEPLNVECLQRFVDTFHFESAVLSIDDALRAFLELFVLPGEAQQIARIMERFAQAYFAHSPGPLVNADAAYILAYSVIMLNTDAHNPQVTKKMTKEEFVRNLRGINAEADLPFDYLSHLFDSITQNALKITTDALNALSLTSSGSSVELSQRQWTRVLDPSKGTRFQTRAPRAHGRDMFALMWQSAIAMFSAYLDNRALHTIGLPPLYADAQPDAKLLSRVLDGLNAFAHVCHIYELHDSFNSLMIALSRSLVSFLADAHQEAVNLSISAASVFARDRRARLLCVTLFNLLRRYSDHCLHEACPNVIHCLLWLHRDQLIPVQLTDMEDFRDSNGGKLESLCPAKEQLTMSHTSKDAIAKQNKKVTTSSSLSYLVSFLFTEEELSSQDSNHGEDQASFTEDDWLSLAVETMQQCRLEELSVNSKRLSPLSLSWLTRTLFALSACSQSLPKSSTKSFSPPSPSPHTINLDLFAESMMNESSAIFALERLADVIESNASRLDEPTSHMWSALIEHCQYIFSLPHVNATFYLERLIVNLFRFSVRLLPPHCLSPSVSVAQCLQLLGTMLLLPPTVLHTAALAHRVTAGLNLFVQTQCDSIHDEASWSILVQLILAFRLSSIAAHSALNAFIHCVEHALQPTNVNLFIDACHRFNMPLLVDGQSLYIPISEHQVSQLAWILHVQASVIHVESWTVAEQPWHVSLLAMAESASQDSRPVMRRLMMDNLARALSPSQSVTLASSRTPEAELWVQCVRHVLIPLADRTSRFPREHITNISSTNAMSPTSRSPIKSPSSFAHPTVVYDLHEKAVQLLFQTLLHRLDILCSDHSRFAQFWPCLLTFCHQHLQKAHVEPEMKLQFIHSIRNLFMIMSVTCLFSPSVLSMTSRFVSSLSDEQWRELLSSTLAQASSGAISSASNQFNNQALQNVTTSLSTSRDQAENAVSYPRAAPNITSTGHFGFKGTELHSRLQEPSSFARSPTSPTADITNEPGASRFPSKLFTPLPRMNPSSSFVPKISTRR